MATKPTHIPQDHRQFYAEVGRLIQKARKARSMTQGALADHISLTRTSVANIERGEQKFLLHTLLDIAQALRVPPDSLLPEHYEPQKEQIDAVLKNTPASVANWIKTAVAKDGKGQDDGNTA